MRARDVSCRREHPEHLIYVCVTVSRSVSVSNTLLLLPDCYVYAYSQSCSFPHTSNRARHGRRVHGTSFCVGWLVGWWFHKTCRGPGVGAWEVCARCAACTFRCMFDNIGPVSRLRHGTA